TVKEGASGNVISLNLIGFNKTGVLLDGATSNTVKSNWIGVTAEGGGIGNSEGDGILVTHAAAKNIVSGNQIGNFSNGIWLEGLGVTGNLIQLNDIGVASSGAAAPNVRGVLFEGGASRNTVGGVSAASRNIVSNNTTANITISDSNSSGNVVQSNY